MKEAEAIEDHITSLFVIQLMIKEGASQDEILEFIEEQDHMLCGQMDSLVTETN